MPIVAMPDGAQVEFPDEMPAEQIKGLIAAKFPDVVNSNPQQERGFSAITQPIANFIDAQRERGAHLNDIVNATQQGNKTLPEGIAEGAMNSLAGPVGDIGGTAGQIAGKVTYDMSPKPVQNVLDTVQQKLAPIAQQYQQNLDTYNKQNPRMGDALQAIRETSNLLPFANSGVRNAIGEGTETAANAFKNTSNDAIKSAINAIKKEPIPTYESTKALANASYAKADSLGATYNPEIRNTYIDTIKNMLPGDEKLLPGNTTIEKIYEQALSKKDKPLTLQGIQQIDEELTDLKYNAVHQNGLPTSEGKKIGDIQRTLRDLIDNAPESAINGGKEGYQALKDGRSIWAASRKIYEINKIFERAALTDNEAAAIRNGFKNLYLNDKKLAGYTPKEQSLIRSASKSSLTANILRTQVGSRMVSAMIGTAAGSIGGVPGMAAGAAIGASTGGAARTLAGTMQKGRGNKVLRQIGKNIKKTGE